LAEISNFFAADEILYVPAGQSSLQKLLISANRQLNRVSRVKIN